MSEEVKTGKIPLKLFDAERMVRKGVVVSTFSELVEKCTEKFNVPSDGSLKIVLNADGVEVEEDYFYSLEKNSTLLVLKGDERWCPPTEPSTSSKKNGKESNEVVNSEEILKLVENLRKKPASVKRNLQESPIKLTVGWLHYSMKAAKYKQVRSSKGEKSATDNLVLKCNISYDEILEKAVRIYFPKGKSKMGKKEHMELSLGTVKGEPIVREGFSLEKYRQETQTQKLRLYLLTKPKLSHFSVMTSSEESDDIELPEINFSKKPRMSSEVSDQLQQFKFQDYFPIPEMNEQASPLQQVPAALEPSEPTPVISQPDPIVLQELSSSSPQFLTASEPSQQASVALQQSIAALPSMSLQVNAPLHLDAGTPTVSFNVNSSTCCICMERDRNTALYPCGHIFCMVCAVAQESSMNKTCSLCRKFIKSILKLVN